MPDNGQARLAPETLEAIRYEVIRTMVAIVQDASRAWMGDQHFLAHVGEIFLLSAIYLENAEGRGTKLGALATDLGIPRSTMERRISELEEAGYLERRNSELWIPERALRLPVNIGMIQAFATHIRRCHEAIEKIKREARPPNVQSEH